MNFHSAIFIPFFLIVFILHWSARSLFPTNRLILGINMLIFSFVFYSFFSVPFLFLFLWLGSVDYGLALLIESAATARAKKAFLAISVSHGLGVLFFFKYASYTLGMAGFLVQIPLPLGISFFLFQSLSYTIEVFRGECQAKKSWLEYLLFLSFFPQMVAGPIVPAHSFFPQWEKPLSLSQIPVAFAVFLIIFGFFKKLVLADHLAPIADAVFLNPKELGPRFLWMGLVAYSGQIYCDFSGYTDIAQGTALLLGIRLPENFRMPYLATSFSEFWSRWHISLSQWLKSYLYFPLGGNRQGVIVTYRNLILVMVLGGVWHGANLTFLVWGLGHGLFLVIERFLFGGKKGGLLRWGFTQTGVLFLWIFFRSENFETALWVAQGLFVKNGEISAPYTYEVQFLRIFALLMAGHTVGHFFFQENALLENRIESWVGKVGKYFLPFGFAICGIVIVLLAGDSKSFIYFVF